MNRSADAGRRKVTSACGRIAGDLKMIRSIWSSLAVGSILLCGASAPAVARSDVPGSFASNLELSRGRAQAVVTALKVRHKIAPERLAAHGVGPLAPVASNRTESGRAKNRRVELIEAPTQSSARTSASRSGP